MLAEHQQSARERRQMIIQELKTLRSQEQIRPDINLETEANVLLTLVNGISLDTLIHKQRLSPEQQQVALTAL